MRIDEMLKINGLENLLPHMKNAPEDMDTFEEIANAINELRNGSTGGGGESNIIIVARDVDLTLEGDIEENQEEVYFDATIPASAFPNDFLRTDKYNLIVTIFAEDDGSYIGYTANHFCFQGSDNDMCLALCYDKNEELEIIHSTQIGISSNAENYELMYRGLLGGGVALPATGAKASIYLQKLY